MNVNKQTCYAFTAKAEGGYSNDSCDPGNWTTNKVGEGRLIGSIYGLSAALLSQFYPNITAAQVKNLPPSVYDQVAPSYWDGVWGAKVPSGIDLMLFDFGYNAGVSRSVRLVQGLVGVKADGIMGNVTLEAIQKSCAPASLVRRVVSGKTSGSQDLIDKLYNAQVQYYQGLSTYSTFGRGWVNRAQERRDRSHQLASSPSGSYNRNIS